MELRRNISSKYSSVTMRVFVFLALLGVALAGRRGPRVVGGVPSSIEEFPFIVNMQYYWFGLWWRHDCSGSLLTSRTVLSAAYCYFEKSPMEWRARVGTSVQSGGGSEHAASRLVLHEGYNSITNEHDIAIVHLATPAVFSDIVRVARIPSNNYILPDRTGVTALGWGDLWYNGNAPDQLHKVDTQVINHQICTQRYASLANYPNVTDGMLCSGILDVGGKDACQHDEGGPIVHNNDVIVGIRSWSYECAHEFYPGVNTRVSYYSGWIVENGSV